jgi:hypothetical protein
MDLPPFETVSLEKRVTDCACVARLVLSERRRHRVPLVRWRSPQYVERVSDPGWYSSHVRLCISTGSATLFDIHECFSHGSRGRPPTVSVRCGGLVPNRGRTHWHAGRAENRLSDAERALPGRSAGHARQSDGTTPVNVSGLCCFTPRNAWFGITTLRPRQVV